MSGDLFPELELERARLAASRAARDRMVERLERVDPEGAADEITKEYVEMTVADALDTLRSPGAGEFFGWIEDTDDRWYIGRRHIEDDRHDPLVVDWRAPIAAPYYRATAIEPLGVDGRRRFTLDDGDLIAYLDERLDDPESGAAAAGIPDPVLAEIGAERSGAMREIVATIQAEQDEVIRSPIDRILVVQGGPGTGKTAVALHRAAYLLFEHRARLARDGVLVVGPNQAFLDYIGNVLPALGERSVRQVTVDELCIPRVEVTAIDDDETARWKGAAERLDELETAALAAIGHRTDEDIVVPIGARRHVITVEEFRSWIATARTGTGPINERRVRLQAIARRELTRRSGDDGCWAHAKPLKQAITAAWPTQRPIPLVDRLLPGPRGRRRAWTRADQLLVDEANSLLDGTPYTYGHVIVDEAQDLSAVALRVIGRRSIGASMTLVGDVAQSTAAGGQVRWDDVFDHLVVSRRQSADDDTVVELTIGYRVPEPILQVANRLLPLTGVDASASRSVRTDGVPPEIVRADGGRIPEAVASSVAELRRRHRLTGVVAPSSMHDRLREALAEAGLIAVDHVHDLGLREVPLFAPAAVKGLEFDGVVVVEPGSILRTHTDGLASGPTELGARLLYVAVTRAVRRVVMVTSEPIPEMLAV